MSTYFTCVCLSDPQDNHEIGTMTVPTQGEEIVVLTGAPLLGSPSGPAAPAPALACTGQPGTGVLVSYSCDPGDGEFMKVSAHDHRAERKGKHTDTRA